MTTPAIPARCNSTDDRGARCMAIDFGGDGPHARHLYPATPDGVHFRLGRLQAAVQLFLDGKCDREFLASHLAQSEEGR